MRWHPEKMLSVSKTERGRPSMTIPTTRRSSRARLELNGEASAEEDADFVHTGPGTLAGRYLRRFWQPVAVSAELAAGSSKTVHVLGEDFTLYRGSSGTGFLVDHRCAHRGAQLSVGWVEDDCIRCLYHGWKYDGSGRCVEQVAEDPRFAAKVQIRSYPTQERMGLVFAYLGDGRAPAFPAFPAYAAEGELEVWLELYPCNYFQIWENSADEFHVAWVHSGGGTHRSLAEVPQMFAAETAYGIERRSRRPNGNVRVTQHLMPNCTRVVVPPFKGLAGVGGWRDSYLWFVPQDDENTLFFGIQQVQVAATEMEQYRSARQRFVQDSEVGRPYAQTALNILAGKGRLADYYDHPQSAHIEDIVAQAGQGRIADRVHERLGRTDVGVILMRKLWTRELRALAEGKPLKTWRYTGELPETGI
jgi:5,5'-dehydrodivanillate O-demethylase oxygenase subunit